MCLLGAGMEGRVPDGLCVQVHAGLIPALQRAFFLHSFRCLPAQVPELLERCEGKGSQRGRPPRAEQLECEALWLAWAGVEPGPVR